MSGRGWRAAGQQNLAGRRRVFEVWRTVSPRPAHFALPAVPFVLVAALVGLVACGAPRPDLQRCPHADLRSHCSRHDAVADRPRGCPPPGPAAYAETPTACLGLDPGPCAEVKAAFAALVPADAQVVYVEIGLFGCAVTSPCGRTLVARPAGAVTVEIVGREEPLAGAATAGPDGIAVAAGPAFRVTLAPSSARAIVGQVPFELGHCGLLSGIDLDGSWWDPVGFVDSDHPDAINAAKAVVTATGPNHATLRTAGGLVVQLVRRAGPKALPLCA